MEKVFVVHGKIPNYPLVNECGFKKSRFLCNFALAHIAFKLKNKLKYLLIVFRGIIFYGTNFVLEFVCLFYLFL